MPTTTITAKLDRPYASSGAFDPALVGGIQSGQIEARWYTSVESWVVAYEGLDLTETGPLCPGNSMEVGEAFQSVTNAPTEQGACEGAKTEIATAPAGVYTCNDNVLYVTKIPSSAEGFLWGTIEKIQPDGAIVGLTSRAAISQSPPTIDLEDLGCNQAV